MFDREHKLTKLPNTIENGGVGNDYCATPGCFIQAARNLALCGTCMQLQSMNTAPVEGPDEDNKEVMSK